MNKIEFTLNFPTMPQGTAQQKGERVVFKNGKPIVIHYKKQNVAIARREFEIALRKYRPAEPMQNPVKVVVCLYFDVKTRGLWGHYKDTRPDAENFCKEFFDAMTTQGFWRDDAQIVDMRIVKRYAEQASIYVRAEELEK